MFIVLTRENKEEKKSKIHLLKKNKNTTPVFILWRSVFACLRQEASVWTPTK